MKYTGSLTICNSYNHVFCVLNVYHVFYVFLCDVCYLDVCEYIEYMKYMGSMSICYSYNHVFHVPCVPVRCLLFCTKST